MYVNIIKDTYDVVRTSVKSACEETEDFTVIVNVH